MSWACGRSRPGEADLYSNVERRAVRSTGTASFLEFVKGSRTTTPHSRTTYHAKPAMTPSSGQMDATICSKCSKNLESAQRYESTACQSASRMTERNTSKATHAVLSGRLHPCAVAPSSLQNKGASTKPIMATPTIGLLFRKYLYWPFISVSCATPFLGSTYMSNQGPRDRQVQYFIWEVFFTR